jgi:WD40 repeat protein
MFMRVVNYLLAALAACICLAGCRAAEGSAATGEPALALISQREIKDILFSPDSRVLFSASGNFFFGNIQSWDVPEGVERPLLRDSTGMVTGLALNPAGDLLASASEDGKIRLWDAAHTLLAEWKGHDAPARSVAFSPDGSLLASGGRDAAVRLWDVTTHEARAVLRGHQVDVSGLAFSPDGSLLASSDGFDLRLWDVETGALLPFLPEQHAYDAYGLAFSPDGSLLAFGSAPRTVRVWDVEAAAETRVLEAESGWLMWDVAFSPDGTLLAAGNSDGGVVVWDINTGERRATLRGSRRGVFAVAFSPDGVFLAAGGADKMIRLWRLDDLDELKRG